MRRAAGLLAGLLLPLAAPADDARFTVDDFVRIADVSAPEFSPDGDCLVYVVETANLETDEPVSDLWRVRWDGSDRRALTRTPDASEWQPAYSPDGRYIAFLSDRGGEDAVTQVWLLPAAGGEAEAVTKFPGGVVDYAWSPDSSRLAVIATDPERPEGEKAPPKPAPVVIDRFQFKEDFTGLLTGRRQHLYVVELRSREATQLTSGAHDEHLPSWSPDGRHIAYVTKRGDDPDRHSNWDIWLVEPRAGAGERQLTTFAGADAGPDWESRPAWSPDGGQIAYIRGGLDRDIYYATWQLYVVDVATGATRIAADLDRGFTRPRFAPDGRSVLALVEQSRVTRLSRIELAGGRVTALTAGARFDADFAVAANGRVAVLGGDSAHPYRLQAIERKGLRPIADHNEWLAGKRLAPVEPISFPSADGTAIDGFLVRPVGHEPGRRYPTILRIHGGPVYQYSHEFMADWQVYAAQGFAVVAANPRGSSGRGFAFARAIRADWGGKDAEDVLAAVDHAVRLGVADPERLAIGGRSYGGILTNAVIARDGRFKAAVSGAGASNFLGLYGHDQYVREYEAELGRPWDDREAWDRVSFPFLKAGAISTPTLFYCGERDANVPCHGSEQMYQALRSRGVPTLLVVYPGEWHPITAPSYRRDRMQRHLDWYRRYLGGDQRL
ncbi:MAG: S9 family peptidase [Steroidobacteraceae bacterium]|nr:S9 family peptidase [Steroidobacteraceae bacterium]